MIEGFEFVDGGRTFRCTVEQAGAKRADAWWWFGVSCEAHQRFAPFRAESDDTPASVQARIVAFYEHLLVMRATPYARHWPRGRIAVAAPAAVPASVSEMPAV